MGMQEGIQLVYIWFLKKGAWDFKNTVHISHFAVFCPKHKGKWSESKNWSPTSLSAAGDSTCYCRWCQSITLSVISFVERLSHSHHRHKCVTPSTRLFVFCCACCCTKVTPSQLRALFGSITSALRTETGQDVTVACVIFAHSLFCSLKRLTGKLHTSRRREDSSAWRATEQMVEKAEKKPDMENPVAEAP